MANMDMNAFYAKCCPDRWLSDIISRKVFGVSIFDNSARDSQGDCDNAPTLDAAISYGEVFLYAKIPSDRLEQAIWLQRKGFYVADSVVTLQKGTSVSGCSDGHSRVRFAVSSDCEEVVDIARTSFVFSRFHRDPHIEKTIADRIKAEWAGNYFTGNRGDCMVVAEHCGGIVGFLQLIFSGTMLIIDLIAVRNGYQRRGYASEMIRFAESQLQECDCIRVGTQLCNLPSLRMYCGLGFVPDVSQYVFHYYS